MSGSGTAGGTSRFFDGPTTLVIEGEMHVTKAGRDVLAGYWQREALRSARDRMLTYNLVAAYVRACGSVIPERSIVPELRRAAEQSRVRQCFGNMRCYDAAADAFEKGDVGR